MMDTISLDARWRCDILEGDPDERISGCDVPSLAGFDMRRVAGKTAWLEKCFDLPTPDVCINYWLEIEAVPGEAQLFINERDFGLIQAPLRFDVTDAVALEDNIIAFRIASGAAGSFGAVRLSAVPCE